MVLNGKFIEKEKSSETSKTTEDCNVWYVLFEVEGSVGKQDDKILRHIPKLVYKELIDVIKKDPNMAESSLLKMYAYNDNEKSLNPEHNNMTKVSGADIPKTAMVVAKREDKPSKPKEAEKPKEADGAEGNGESKGDKGKSKGDGDGKKASMKSFWNPQPPGDAPEEEPKKASSKEKSADKSADKASEKAADKPSKAKADASVAPEQPSTEKVEQGSLAEGITSRKRSADSGKEGNGKTLYKRKRTSVVEEHEFVICDTGVKVDFEAPEGATGGKAVITWSFA